MGFVTDFVSDKSMLIFTARTTKLSDVMWQHQEHHIDITRHNFFQRKFFQHYSMNNHLIGYIPQWYFMQPFSCFFSHSDM